jgi:hypothetical protein
MISESPNPSFLFKRLLRRLGLDSKQKSYFFYMPNLKSPKGSLIAFAGVFMVIVAILIPVAMTLVQNIRLNTQQAQLFVAGAQNAAKAGIEDTLGYFIRQKTVVRALNATYIYPSAAASPTPTVFATGITYVDQPFNPQYNPTNFQYSDTFQATTQLTGGMTHPFYGLCNEYPVDSASNTIPAAGQTTAVYFGRYEVQEQTNPVVTPAPTLNPMAVHDITGTRDANYMNGDGLVWAITSTGYIYKRMDYTMDQYGEYMIPYNVYPNKVLATAKAYSEFKKLSCTLPPSGSVSYASAYVHSAAGVNLSSYCYMGGAMADGYGMCAMSGSVTKPTGATATNFLGGGVTYTTLGDAPISDVNVFGMSLKDIQFIADYSGSAAVPLSIVSSNKLSYFNGNLTYAATQTNPVYQTLNTSGILIVNGNLTLGLGGGVSNILPSYYSGIVFVTGNLTISDGCQIDGVAIMGYSSAYSGSGGNLTLLGSSNGQFAYLTADPSSVTHVIQQVAQYREDLSARKVLLAFPGI